MYIVSRLPLWKKCNNSCIRTTEKCNGQCGPDQCELSGQCLSPEHQRPAAFKKHGKYTLKTCNGTCVRAEDLCDNSCGDSRQFCWDPTRKKCLSVIQKGALVRHSLLQLINPNYIRTLTNHLYLFIIEYFKDFKFLRRSCGCTCIPFASLCYGRCGRGQCKHGNKCLDELEVNYKNERIR